VLTLTLLLIPVELLWADWADRTDERRDCDNREAVEVRLLDVEVDLSEERRELLADRIEEEWPPLFGPIL
jgi:hypothetical protein